MPEQKKKNNNINIMLMTVSDSESLTQNYDVYSMDVIVIVYFCPWPKWPFSYS